MRSNSPRIRVSHFAFDERSQQFVGTHNETLPVAIVAFTKSGPRKDHRGVDLISDALPFGRLWYGEPNAVSNAIGYAQVYSRSHDAVIRIYDKGGSVIETPEHKGDFKEW